MRRTVISAQLEQRSERSLLKSGIGGRWLSRYDLLSRGMASTIFGPFRQKPTFGFSGEGHQSPPSAFWGKVLVSQTLRREHNLNQP